MRTAEGIADAGIVVGNTYDKYGTRNPLARLLVHGFENSLSELVARASPKTIHEVGCGEGYWVIRWTRLGFNARGSDFSSKVIELARANAAAEGLNGVSFEARNLYDLKPGDDADLLICLEVLEHLHYPDQALRALERVVTGYLILSVPREPIWRALNVARGKYLRGWGNTPGHLQHWSRSAFVRWVQQYAFDVLAVRSPLPWTLVLCRPRGGTFVSFPTSTSVDRWHGRYSEGAHIAR
jgi:2-polyprenyl-3-methyl-5-hydroxy-6-metoxy-1,4-benzoquinol methylase